MQEKDLNTRVYERKIVQWLALLGVVLFVAPDFILGEDVQSPPESPAGAAMPTPASEPVEHPTIKFKESKTVISDTNDDRPSNTVVREKSKVNEARNGYNSEGKAVHEYRHTKTYKKQHANVKTAPAPAKAPVTARNHETVDTQTEATDTATSKSTNAAATTTTTSTTAPGAVTTQSTEADNTRVNVRDRDKHELTADNQSMRGSDTDITARIRREIVDDKSLSTYAHNVKIITQDGNVTLKGPVRSVDEKRSVEATAQRVAGNNVSSEIEIAP